MAILSHFILATAGHVDHGKSALVKALTGTDPDRLPEEKVRGITIELGFAHLTLSTDGPAPLTFEVGIVDVPGHEDLVKNMVTGVGAIDLALLVVAADDGWMPQTEEHLQILTHLRVPQMVVALAKADLVPSREDALIRSIRDDLSGTGFEDAPIVPTSVLTGRGLEELKSAVLSALAKGTPPRDLGKPRLSVDRAFTLRGIGTIVTGALTGGNLQRGQSVVIQPSGVPSRIRSVQSHSHELGAAGPGMRTALNLADVQVAQRDSTQDDVAAVRRGQVVTLESLGPPSTTLDVCLESTPRLLKKSATMPRSLKDGARVRIYHAAAKTIARLLLLEQKALEPGAQALAQLRCDSPMMAFIGDRFVVRDWTEQHTIGGGVVLNTAADRKGFRSPTKHAFLLRQHEALGDARRMIDNWLEFHLAERRSTLLVQSNFSGSEINQAITALEADGKLFALGDLVVHAPWWHMLGQKSRAAVDEFHRVHPDQLGLPVSQLRAGFGAELKQHGLFDALISQLLQAGYMQTGAFIKRSNHWQALPAQLQAAGAKVRSLLEAKPFDPPSRKELAPDPGAQQALRFLVQTGQAIELSPEVILLAGPYARAVNLVKGHLRQFSKATVSDLRQAVGASRRIVVPLLEKLDREGVTRRQGDLRVLRELPTSTPPGA